MVLEKYSEVIGMPVITIQNGKKIGIIKDIIFSPKTREVKAFVLEKKGYEFLQKAVLLKDVVNLGKDALVVNDHSSVKTLRKAEAAGELKDKGSLKGLKVYTRSGNDLGIIEDILFDFSTGIVEGVEVSDGILQDIVKGRNILPLFGKIEFGEENILVDKEAIDEIETTGGGIKKFLNE